MELRIEGQSEFEVGVHITNSKSQITGNKIVGQRGAADL